MYTYIYIYNTYTYKYIYIRSLVQYGSIPIGGSPHTTPPHIGAARRGAGGGGHGVRRWGVGEGIPYGYIPTSDFAYIFLTILSI